MRSKRRYYEKLIVGAQTRRTRSVIIILLNWLFFVFDHFVVIFVVAPALSFHSPRDTNCHRKESRCQRRWNLNWIVLSIRSMIDIRMNSCIMDLNEDNIFFSFFLFVSEVEFKKEKKKTRTGSYPNSRTKSERMNVYNRLIKIQYYFLFLYGNRKTVVNFDNILSFVSNPSDTHIVLRRPWDFVSFVCVLFFFSFSRNGFDVCIFFYVTLNRL